MLPYIANMLSSLVYFSYYLTKVMDAPGLIVSKDAGLIITQLIMIVSSIKLAHTEYS